MARPIGTGIVCAGVLLVGVVSLSRLAVDLLPSVDFPQISILTTYEGVAPQEMETLITRPIEQAVGTIDGIDEIEAISAEGISRVELQFAWGTNLDVAVADVRGKLDRIADELPEDAERPVVHKFDLSSVDIATIGLSGTGDPRRLRNIAEETISRRLERITGVAAVGVDGGRVREIRVELDASTLISLGISASEVVNALASDNRNVSAGDMRATREEVLVRTVGQWESPEEIDGVLVAVRDGRPVYVRDLGTVVDGVRELQTVQWVDSDPGITLDIAKQSGANTIEVIEDLRAAIAEINADYEGRLRLVMLRNSGDYIENAVANVQQSALYGAVLAVLILLIFLRDLRATLLVGAAIPLSVIATFALMFLADFSLNLISFGGLAIGIGMLVDNSIVILENIYRKREEGVGRVRAAIEGAREVGPSVIAGTATTIAVFAPVVFLGGFAGVFFGEMASVVSFALGCSLLAAITLVPTVAARFSARTRAPGPVSRGLETSLGRLERGYQRFLSRAIRAPWFVVACAVVLLLASVRLSATIGFEMMPETDEGRVDIDFEMPVGTPVEQTAQVAKEIEQRTLEVIRPEEITGIVTTAGAEGWWSAGGHEGEVEINLVPVSQRERGTGDIEAALRDAIKDMPGVELSIDARSTNFLMRIVRGRSGDRLAVEIRGHDLEDAARLADRVVKSMQSIPGVVDVRIDRNKGLRERTVIVDAARAAEYGLTRAAVADTVETYLLGTVATRFRDGGDEFDVRVQLRPEDNQQVEKLADLPIVTASGEAVPLSSVATFGGRRGPSEISREGQERVLEVLGDVSGRPLSDVVAELDRAIDQIEMPRGFSLAIAGEHEEQQETFSSLIAGLVLAVLLVYAVMAFQFESIRHPLVILTAVPFGFVGVAIALAATGTTFNMNSFLGAIVLVGIAVNNAIVLVDYTNLLRREQGFDLVTAIVESGRRRLRPIMMTTLTTCFAMMPLAIGLGAGSEIQAPLARVVVGGLLASTLVTLILVPCIYYLIERRRADPATSAPATVRALHDADA